MAQAVIEHVNLTVSDPEKIAQTMMRIFGWKIRWQGPAMAGGYMIHVGGDDTYLALYKPREPKPGGTRGPGAIGALNHVGVVVDDLNAVEKNVVAEGFRPHSHADYEPGRRFYFDDGDGIEYEVVSYA